MVPPSRSATSDDVCKTGLWFWQGMRLPSAAIRNSIPAHIKYQLIQLLCQRDRACEEVNFISEDAQLGRQYLLECMEHRQRVAYQPLLHPGHEDDPAWLAGVEAHFEVVRMNQPPSRHGVNVHTGSFVSNQNKQPNCESFHNSVWNKNKIKIISITCFVACIHPTGYLHTRNCSQTTTICSSVRNNRKIKIEYYVFLVKLCMRVCVCMQQKTMSDLQAIKPADECMANKNKVMTK